MQAVAANNYGTGYAPALRKICRVVDRLAFSAADLATRRSALGSFADILRALTKNGDREVRSRATALLAPLAPARGPSSVSAALPPPRKSAPGRGGTAAAPRSNDGRWSEGGGSRTSLPLPPPPAASAAAAADRTAAATPPAAAAGASAPEPLAGEPPAWLAAAAAVGVQAAEARAAAMLPVMGPDGAVGRKANVIDGLNAGLYGSVSRPVAR